MFIGKLPRILRYLKGTIVFALHFQPFSELHITGYCDADWAVCHEDRKSVAGFCVYLGDSLISWSSRKQAVVSRSSTESEYRAIADLASELLWVKALLKEIHCPITRIPIIWSDNLGAGSLAVNPVCHSRMKHIELDLHFVRDKVADKELIVGYVPSIDQNADCLTKASSQSRFEFLRTKLGVTKYHQV